MHGAEPFRIIIIIIFSWKYSKLSERSCIFESFSNDIYTDAELTGWCDVHDLYYSYVYGVNDIPEKVKGRIMWLDGRL